MGSPERSCVFFHKPDFGLSQAEAALREKGLLTVSRKGEILTVTREESPRLFVHFVHGEGVRKDAVRVGKGHPLEARLRKLDAAFVITFEDLDEVLDETNALIELQSELQGATAGVIARSWNDELSFPEEE